MALKVDTTKRMLYIRCMIRTQIYLTQDLHREIKSLAEKEKKSQADIIRRALKKGLKRNRSKETAGDALLRIARLAGRGPKDLSKNIDKYLYEE